MRIRAAIIAAVVLAMACTAVPLASVAAQTAGDAVALPDTTAGRQFRTWLGAFNSDDPAEFDAVMAREYPTWGAPPRATQGLREMTGGFTPVRVESASEGQITVLLEEKNWEGAFARVTLDVEPRPDGKVTAVQLQGVPPPADYTPPARMSEAEALAAFKTKLDTFSDAGRFSGAAKVARNGETVFDYVAGQADRERGEPNTLDTLFRIGSMNKMFTAVSVLQLADAGKIDLDAPIGTYLENYPNKDLASRVTVKHLLTHTGGTGDFFGPEFFARRLELCEHSDYLALFGPRDVAFTPGERFAYSNYGYQLLGAIIESVSGQSYYDYVEQHVYAPAGMAASASLPESVDVPGRSIGYTAQLPGSNGQLRRNTDTLPCRGTSAGGGYSTVGDLIRFSEALRGGKLLDRELLAAATTPQFTPGNYGYGFVANEVNGTRAYGHSGGAPGMSAELMVFPELGYAVAVAANIDTPLVTRLVQYLGARLPASATASLATR